MNGSGTTYTANVTTSGENNYFSFTKKLASGTAEPGTEVWNAAWDEILPYRFGAEEGEGDCDVVVGQAMPLGAEGTARAYKIGAGNWTFTLDLAARTFTVTQQGDTPTPQPGDDYFVMGEVNGNGWFPNVGEKMVGKGNNIYTLDATTDGSSNGFNYFSFTKKLYPSPIEYDETNPGPWEEAWASIADYRFGAEGVEDYPVVENQAMPLGLDGTSTAFKIGAGEWTFNLNMTARTLTVTKGQPAGYNFDVNGDGQVTATDIACIVNVLAGLEPASKYNGRTDVNKDGNTTATDISMIVNHLAGL